MLVGLVVGIIIGVIVLGLLSPFLVRRYINRRKRKHTQIYVLPPPVQTRSTLWPTAQSPIQREARYSSASYQQMMPASRTLSACDPIAVEQVVSPSSSVSTMIPRIRSLADFTPIPADFLANTPTIRSLFERTPHPATYVISPIEDPTLHDDDATSPAFAHVATRTPALKKTQTLRSSTALARYPSSAVSGPVSAMLSPKTPDRANTFHSGSTRLSSRSSPSADYSAAEEPVVQTAVMYQFSNENMPRWNSASMLQYDNGRPTVPGSTLVPTAYVPYRPPIG